MALDEPSDSPGALNQRSLATNTSIALLDDLEPGAGLLVIGSASASLNSPEHGPLNNLQPLTTQPASSGSFTARAQAAIAAATAEVIVAIDDGQINAKAVECTGEELNIFSVDGAADPRVVRDLPKFTSQHHDQRKTAEPSKERLGKVSASETFSADTYAAVTENSDQRRAVDLFVKKLEQYVECAKTHGRIVSSEPTKISDGSLQTVSALLPYHDEFEAAGLAVTSLEQVGSGKVLSPSSKLRVVAVPDQQQTLPSPVQARQIPKIKHEPRREAVDSTSCSECDTAILLPSITDMDDWRLALVGRSPTPKLHRNFTSRNLLHCLNCSPEAEVLQLESDKGKMEVHLPDSPDQSLKIRKSRSGLKARTQSLPKLTSRGDHSREVIPQRLVVLSPNRSTSQVFSTTAHAQSKVAGPRARAVSSLSKLTEPKMPVDGSPTGKVKVSRVRLEDVSEGPSSASSTANLPKTARLWPLPGSRQSSVSGLLEDGELPSKSRVTGGHTPSALALPADAESLASRYGSSTAGPSRTKGENGRQPRTPTRLHQIGAHCRRVKVSSGKSRLRRPVIPPRTSSIRSTLKRLASSKGDPNISDRRVLKGLRIAAYAACDADLDASIAQSNGLEVRQFLIMLADVNVWTESRFGAPPANRDEKTTTRPKKKSRKGKERA